MTYREKMQKPENQLETYHCSKCGKNRHHTFSALGPSRGLLCVVCRNQFGVLNNLDRPERKRSPESRVLELETERDDLLKLVREASDVTRQAALDLVMVDVPEVGRVMRNIYAVYDKLEERLTGRPFIKLRGFPGE